MRLLFLGAPGVGKGTYATRLAKQWKIPHVSTGDIIRHEIKAGSALGRQFVSFSDSGALVPDTLVVDMVRNRLAQPDCGGGYILDGFPRTVPQAEALATFSLPRLCVNIHLPQRFLLQKLCSRRVCKGCGANFNVADIQEGEYCMPPLLPNAKAGDPCMHDELEQRADDTEEVVAQRLRLYDAETAPLIEFYAKAGVLATFDVKRGLDDLPLIRALILEKLGMTDAQTGSKL